MHNPKIAVAFVAQKRLALGFNYGGEDRSNVGCGSEPSLSRIKKC